MKKLLIALTACATTLLASAAITTSVGFEDNDPVSFTGTGGSAVEYGDTTLAPANYPFADAGSKYCEIDADGNDTLSSPTASGATYFDMYIQFPANASEPDPELDSDAKLAVYVNASSNLVVLAGDGNGATVTNETGTTIAPGAWKRLTIAKVEGGYQVYVDGRAVSDAAFTPIISGDPTTVAFTGCGKLDNFVARTTDPFFDYEHETYVANIGGQGGEYYASYSDALADALAESTPASITLADGTTTMDGTAANPYQIASADDLIALKDAVLANAAVRSLNFVQTANIDMTSAGAFAGIGVYADNPTAGTAFTGTYDGQGYKISNVTFTDRDYAGIFNQVNGGTIQNLTVENITFPGTASKCSASIIGNAGNGATLKNLVAEGSFGSAEKPGKHNMAGIAIRLSGGGENGTLVQNCTNNAALYGNYTKLAGICALTQVKESGGAVTFDGCANNGDLYLSRSSNGVTGFAGIVGYVSDATVFQNCANTGTLNNTQTGANTDKNGQLAGGVYTGYKLTLNDIGTINSNDSAPRFGSPYDNATVTIAWNPGSIRFVLDDFGNANSTVEIVGANGAFGAFPFSAWSGGDAPTVVTKVAIAEGTTWTVANGNAHRNDSDWNITTFPVLTGGGNLVVNGSTSGEEPIEYEIAIVTNFTGTLSGNRGKYKFGNIAVAGTPGFDDCLVKVGDNFKYRDLDQTTVNGESETLAVGTVSEQKGVYLARATVADVGYVSVADAIAAAESAGVNLVTVLDGTSATQAGWIYTNGTYVPTVATVGDTPYASLEAAIAAADVGETKTVVVYRRTSESVSIPAGVTVQSNTTEADFCGTLTGGTGVLEYAQTPSVPPTIGENFAGTVCLNFNYSSKNISDYGGANSTIALGNMTGYLANAMGLIASTVRVDGDVCINDGWPLSDANWNDAKVVKFSRLRIDKSLEFSYIPEDHQPDKRWSGYGYYKTSVLDGVGEGSITVGNRFALRIDAVDFAAAPSGTDALVNLTLTGETAGLLYGPNGVAGEPIPVTTNGVATGQSLVYDAAKGGLVLYVEPSPSPAIDPDQGTTVDVDTTKSEEDQRTEAESAAAAMDVAKTADASGVDQAIWNGYFTKTVEKVNDKWVATATLNPAVVLPVDGVEETPLTVMLESVTEAALDTDKDAASVPTKVGLYYWIAGATEVGATTYTPGTARLGDGTTMELAMPVLSGENGKAFYKVCVDLAAPVTAP